MLARTVCSGYGNVIILTPELRKRPGFAYLHVVKGLNPQPLFKGTLLGTPNREPQEYRNITQYRDPGRYIPIIFLLSFTVKHPHFALKAPWPWELKVAR